MEFDFSFETKPKITKEFLLSKNNQETYMSYYMGIPITNKPFKSPLRVDHKVTCTFFKSKSGVLYFKDFATGECLSWINVIMVKYNCDYHTALNIAAKDFGLLPGTNNLVSIEYKQQPELQIKDQTFIQVEVQEFSELELKWWNSFGITPEILKKYHVHSCRTVFLNGQIFTQSTKLRPVFGYYFGKKDCIEQWKIYMPKSKLRFINNANKNLIQGYKQLPKSGKLLVITKSMKDLMAFSRFGIPAISPQSETTFMDDKILNELKERFTNIVVLFDNDLAGIRGMNVVKRSYPELNYVYIPRNSGSKDFTDYIRDHGLAAAEKLIKLGYEKLGFS